MKSPVTQYCEAWSYKGREPTKQMLVTDTSDSGENWGDLIECFVISNAGRCLVMERGKLATAGKNKIIRTVPINTNDSEKIIYNIYCR